MFWCKFLCCSFRCRISAINSPKLTRNTRGKTNVVRLTWSTLRTSSFTYPASPALLVLPLFVANHQLVRGIAQWQRTRLQLAILCCMAFTSSWRRSSHPKGDARPGGKCHSLCFDSSGQWTILPAAAAELRETNFWVYSRVQLHKL